LAQSLLTMGLGRVVTPPVIGVKPYYMQLRYINQKGNERVRLDYDGTHNKNYSRFPTAKLSS
ncbi:hypothetical protein, partial [Microcoleus sp. herbarium2]|uniref:hypothetical protein n=1 Tax=Microcoleus sp. herbarium2 TaxID=3055433 RepID=UPI002FD46430